MRIEQVDVPFQIDIGAPNPIILADELNVYLTFYVQEFDPNWDGSYIKVRTIDDEGIVTIKFQRVFQYKFGSPNDEAISGHPYYKLGLQPYSVQIVHDSDWIKELISMNSVHPYHNPKIFENAIHYIFFFHDNCFEIVCEKFELDPESKSTMSDEIKRIADKLRNSI